ncbi:MAG: DUF3631 domain-containing protein [Actinomycetota bacterium]
MRIERDWTADDPQAHLAKLLDDLRRLFHRYIVFPSVEACDTLALWTLHTHVFEAFESTPRLALLSPEKGSGKTRTLELLDLLVPEPMHAVNLSAAALFRMIQSKGRVTLLLDECDTYLGPRVAKDHEELRGLINAGHRRGAVAYRCVGEPSKMEIREFPAFAPVALAGIGDLPDTVLDRAAVIPMRRRAPGERVEDFRRRKVQGPAEDLKKRCSEWAATAVDALSLAEPEMPVGITDRPADVWEPMIAIGDMAGSAWGTRARAAAVALNNIRQKVDPSLGVQLLRDVRRIFAERKTDRLFTVDLVTALCGLDESPWGDLRGKEIDARGVARRLRPYDIRPKQIRDGESKKGYERGDFLDSWSRYLPDPPGTETSVTQETTTGAVTADSDVSVPQHREEGKLIVGWSWDNDPAPCVLCGEPCVPRDPEGRIQHPECQVQEVLS